MDPSNPFNKPEICRVCPLFHEPGPVWGFPGNEGGGPAARPIFLLGEAPGAEEVDDPRHNPERFRPFIGGSGRLLTALCIGAGINRKEETFVSNVVKCRPPKNRTPTEEEIGCCSRFLQEELEAVSANIIIALGDTALWATTGRRGITNWRGVPLEGLGGRKIFPTWHPAYIARAQYQWQFSVHDLARAKVQSAFPEIRRIPYDIIRQSSVPLDDLLREAQARQAATYDLETTGLSKKTDRIIYLGLVTKTNEARVLDWGPQAQELFQRLVDDPGIELVGQNVLYFDLPFLREKGVDISQAWSKTFDTMVAFHLCNASYGATSVKGQEKGAAAQGMGKDLTMIASCHTDMPYWKSPEDYKRDLQGVCGQDVIATDRSALNPGTGLKDELRELGMVDLYYKHVLPVHPILDEMNQLGIRIDEDRASTWSCALHQEADRLEATLRDGFGDPFLNLESTKQLSELLYDRLKLPKQWTDGRMVSSTYRPGYRISVNVDALDNLARLRPENEILRGILDVRKTRKMTGTYVDPLLRAGWAHPAFGVSKAATGRFNSWNPNAQNVPEDMRDFWVPDNDECVLLAMDWSQIEWRLSMILSGDPVGLELLSKGVDNHRAVAAEALQKGYDEVSDIERQSAKMIVYGLGYGRGAKSLAESPLSHVGGTDRNQIIMSEAFVKKFIHNFLTRFRYFRDWREQNVRFVERNNYLANAFGRRRWWYTQATTEVYNYPQQSTAADMMYDALIWVHAGLPKGATLRLTVHDELVLNVPKDVIRETWDHVKASMERTWPQIVSFSAFPEHVKKFYPRGWFCPADGGIGTNWKMTKSKAPEDKAARKALAKHLGLEKELL